MQQELYDELYADNLKMQDKIEKLNTTVHDMYSIINDLIEQMKYDEEYIRNLEAKQEKEANERGIRFAIMQAQLDNMKYEILDPENSNCFFPKFRSDEETLRLIIEQGKSLARFGDGEFSIAFNVPRHKFQRLDAKLAERIWEVLHSDHPDLLIAVAPNYGSLEKYSEHGRAGIRFYMTEETRERHEKILSADRVYSNAYMTRPYMMYKDTFTDGPRRRFDALKQIWENKRIVTVEGALTRLGVGNDLFCNVREHKRIIAPPTSSFDKYDEILEECKRRRDEADLFILAIGPSSGVLAYDLTTIGCQAVDVGHIDIDYEWFLAGKGERVAVPNKYNNEFPGGDIVAPIHDPLYDSQIIASFA